MRGTEVCSKCGSKTVVKGTVLAQGAAWVELTVPHGVFSPSSRIDAYVCPDCGYTEFYAADPNVLKRA